MMQSDGSIAGGKGGRWGSYIPVCAKFKCKAGSEFVLALQEKVLETMREVEGTRCDSPAAGGSYGFPVNGACSLLGLVMKVEVRVSGRWQAQSFKRVASAFILWSRLHAKGPIERVESPCIDHIAIPAQLVSLLGIEFCGVGRPVPGGSGLLQRSRANDRRRRPGQLP